jgi:hypothetical protein
MADVPPGQPCASTGRATDTVRSALLFKCLLLAAFLASAFYLRWSLRPIAPIEPPKPDFEMAVRNYDRVKSYMTLSEVEALLGSPSGDPQDPVLVGLQQFYEENKETMDHHQSWPRLGDPAWKMWRDPDDKARWIVVWFHGVTVRMTYKGGF